MYEEVELFEGKSTEENVEELGRRIGEITIPEKIPKIKLFVEQKDGKSKKSGCKLKKDHKTYALLFVWISEVYRRGAKEFELTEELKQVVISFIRNEVTNKEDPLVKFVFKNTGDLSVKIG